MSMLTLDAQTIDRIRDRAPRLRTGRTTPPMPEEHSDERVTVRELIRGAVEEELETRRQVALQWWSFFLSDTSVEAMARGSLQKQERKVPPAVQIAWQGFIEERFHLFVSGHRMQSLDQWVRVTSDTQVIFIRPWSVKGA